MTAAGLLKDLCQRGIKLEINGDKLRYSPKSAVPAEMVEQIRASKPELTELLRSKAEQRNERMAIQQEHLVPEETVDDIGDRFDAQVRQDMVDDSASNSPSDTTNNGFEVFAVSPLRAKQIKASIDELNQQIDDAGYEFKTRAKLLARRDRLEEELHYGYA